jgi:hypothetical protein
MKKIGKWPDETDEIANKWQKKREKGTDNTGKVAGAAGQTGNAGTGSKTPLQPCDGG